MMGSHAKSQMTETSSVGLSYKLDAVPLNGQHIHLDQVTDALWSLAMETRNHCAGRPPTLCQDRKNNQ